MPRGASSDSRPRRGRGASRVGEWLVVIFCFGVLAFSPLVIKLFDRGAGATVLGVPLLYFYLFGAWALLIVAIMLVMESRTERRAGPIEAPRQRPPGEARQRPPGEAR